MSDVANEVKTEVKEKSTLVKDTLILFAITVVAAILLGMVYEITKDPIAQAEEQAKVTAYQTVFPELVKTEQNADLDACVAASADMIAQYPDLVGSEIVEALVAADASGNPLGLVLTVANTKGYGGRVEFTMGVDNSGMLKGIEFLTLNETAGLGMKAKNDDFKDQFKDVNVTQFAFAKAKIAGDVEVDAISSASITTKAVTRALNSGLLFASECMTAGVGGVGHE